MTVAQRDLGPVISALRAPAGDDPRFQSRESIREHQGDFVAAFHAGLKRIHGEAIDELLRLEDAVAATKGQPLPPDFLEYLKWMQQLWRKVNDAIVWHLVGHRGHIIRRWCGYRPRPNLHASNPDSIRPLLDQLNEEPLKVAVWTDATACLDVGDILLIDRATGEMNVVEVKEGKVNEAILDLLSTKGESVPERIWDFLDTHGPKGAAQLERNLRQHQTSARAQELITRGQGVDPFLEVPVVIPDVATPDETYDDTLAEVLQEVRKAGEVTVTIDDTLTIHVGTSQPPSTLLATMSDKLKRPLDLTGRRYTRNTVETLERGAWVPDAIPLYLRGIPVEDVRAILIGNLFRRVLLHIDWEGFGTLITGAGAGFTWSTEKEGRSQHSKPHRQRRLTIEDRIPMVTLGDHYLKLGDRHLARMLFDGIRPRTVATQLVETLSQLGQRVSSDTGSDLT